MSKLTPKFKGSIKSGKLILEKPQIFGLYLGNFEGKRVDVIVQKEKKARSLKANSYYWLCLSHIGSEIGEDSEELHTTFKAMFLVDRSKQLPIVRSTASLSTEEFAEYLDKIERRVAEIGIILPDPNEYYSVN